MSDTPVDMPKVAQLLDSGRCVFIFKNDIGSYTAQCFQGPASPDNPGYECITDDFTPEQALTRLAYKVRGEIL